MSRFQFEKEPDQVYKDEITTPEFWPDILMSDFVRERRIPTEYDQGQQRESLKRAIAIALTELGAWQEMQESQGKQHASECGPVIDGTGIAASLFISAIYDRAKATLLSHFKTVNRREEANNIAKEDRETYDELLREYQESIRAILEISSTSVKLL